MFRLIVLCAIVVAARTESEVTAVFRPSTSYGQDRAYQTPVYIEHPSGHSIRKRSAALFNAYEQIIYRAPSAALHSFHSSLFSNLNENRHKQKIQKRSISFEPPKFYAAATPYAPSFYAPPTIPFTFSSPLLPRGPYVSAYTAPAHYIQKRLSYLAPPFAAIYPPTVITNSPGSEYAIPAYIIQKRDIMELQQN